MLHILKCYVDSLENLVRRAVVQTPRVLERAMMPVAENYHFLKRN